MLTDLAAVQKLLTASGLHPIEDVTHFIDQYVVAVTNGGSIIGTAGVEVYGDAGLLRSVAVDDTFRSSGVGKRLIASCQAKAKQAGLAALYLLTTDAMDYWTRRGFIPIARDSAPGAIQSSHQWTISCPQSAIAMKQDIIDSK
jgi:amino-acid N-acetyltransferase